MKSTIKFFLVMLAFSAIVTACSEENIAPAHNGGELGTMQTESRKF